MVVNVVFRTPFLKYSSKNACGQVVRTDKERCYNNLNCKPTGSIDSLIRCPNNRGGVRTVVENITFNFT